MASIRPAFGITPVWRVFLLIPIMVTLEWWIGTNVILDGHAALHPGAYCNLFLAQQAQYARHDLVATEHFQKEALKCYEGNQINDSLYASASNRLGVTLAREGKYDEAASHLEEALTVRRKLYPKESLWVAKTLVDLGRVSRDNSDFKRSQQCLEEALRINSLLKGPVSAETVNTMAELGMLHNEMGDPYFANHYLRVACEKSDLHCPDLRLKILYAILQKENGPEGLAAAKNTCQEAIAAYHRDRHVRCSFKWNHLLDLAILCRNLGYFDDSEYFFQKASRRATRYGANLPEAIQVKLRWAEKYFLEGKYAQSEVLTKEVLNCMTGCSLERMDAKYLLCLVYLRTGREEGACALSKQSYSDLVSLAGYYPGVQHPRHYFHRFENTGTLY